MQHTATQPRITAITQTHQTIFNKSIFIIALAAFGGITVLGSLISLVSAILLLSNASLASLAGSISTDAVFDFTIGALMIASSRTLAKGKILTIWLYGGSILLDILYSLMMGYQLHYIFIGLGFLLIWQMLKFKKEWAVS